MVATIYRLCTKCLTSTRDWLSTTATTAEGRRNGKLAAGGRSLWHALAGTHLPPVANEDWPLSGQAAVLCKMKTCVSNV